MTERFTKTKIICTIGPATASSEKITPLVQSGMDIARLNFSHGNHEEHAAHISAIRQIENDLGQTIPILADLGGPKLRLGKLEEEFEVFPEDKITITTEEVIGKRDQISTTYSDLPKDVKVGDIILIDDGYVSLEVKEIKDHTILCNVLDGGVLRSRKGINLPGIKISSPTITEKDRKDIDFALEQNVDFFALSFVRSHQDIIELRELLLSKGSEKPIIAKIEKPEAIDDIDAIIQEANAVMIARGDLGVEMPTEEIPILQKMIIEKCKTASRPVITATQMLESMVHNTLPTRAEASDVANAVFDGTDAVMLSAETSIGKHPTEAVAMMNKIVTRAEKNCAINPELFSSSFRTDQFSIDLSKAACMIAQDINASAIFAITKTGRTARHLSKYRVQNPIYAFTSNEETLKFLTLIWGVKGLLLPGLQETDETLRQVKHIALDQGLISDNEIIVFVAGIPLQTSNEVNMIKLDQV
ncbi:MAG TPA: pyruvate kinase [Candidatus Cloacimonetes bacterium]|nr:pyruvate kinase [Candidatus Cloacimonadota bacterium]HEX38090.1 pyruvate kinase [Candidatus Cloacimonadota bacterium]